MRAGKTKYKAEQVMPRPDPNKDNGALNWKVGSLTELFGKKVRSDLTETFGQRLKTLFAADGTFGSELVSAAKNLPADKQGTHPKRAFTRA